MDHHIFRTRSDVFNYLRTFRSQAFFPLKNAYIIQLYLDNDKKARKVGEFLHQQFGIGVESGKAKCSKLHNKLLQKIKHIKPTNDLLGFLSMTAYSAPETKSRPKSETLASTSANDNSLDNSPLVLTASTFSESVECNNSGDGPFVNSSDSVPSMANSVLVTPLSVESTEPSTCCSTDIPLSTAICSSGDMPSGSLVCNSALYSLRKTPTSPNKLVKRLHSVQKSTIRFRQRNRKKMELLNSKINLTKVCTIKTLNRELKRKSNAIKALKQKIADIESQHSKTAMAQQNIALQRSLDSAKRDVRRKTEKLRKSETESAEEVHKIVDENQKLKKDLEETTSRINFLENSLDEASTSADSALQKEGKSFSPKMRMLVYTNITNNVPTNNIPGLIKSTCELLGLNTPQLPCRNTVEIMTRELGVISDYFAAELLINGKNATIGFDATTQEGRHVNSVHVTTPDRCHVLAVDELPGGTAADYEYHINESIDNIANVYCKFHGLDFCTVKESIRQSIKNTMTDRAAVNHATIVRLENSWGTVFNELNCHVHPLATIATGSTKELKSLEPSALQKKLYGSDCLCLSLILSINKMRFKDGKGDPKGFRSALTQAKLPLTFLPRYRGSRLHVMFDIAAKLHSRRDFFLDFLCNGVVSCGGLQSSISHDFSLQTAQTQLHVLGLLGKLLTGPWMSLLYKSADTQMRHLDAIPIFRVLVNTLREYASQPGNVLLTKKDFFGENLSMEIITANLQKEPVDTELFKSMMTACLLKTVEVIEAQYSKYFKLDITQELIIETESARCHNIDAETVMGMFSAALKHSPNATMSFFSARIRAQKNDVAGCLKNLSNEDRDRLINLATTLGKKEYLKKRQRHKDVLEEISKRLREKGQKKTMADRLRIEKTIKATDYSTKALADKFTESDENVLKTASDILTGRAVGHSIGHIWYDSDSQKKTFYWGKLEKLLKKCKGTYRIAYWLEDGSYDDAEDYDITAVKLAADAICGDLNLLKLSERLCEG